MLRESLANGSVKRWKHSESFSLSLLLKPILVAADSLVAPPSRRQLVVPLRGPSGDAPHGVLVGGRDAPT